MMYLSRIAINKRLRKSRQALAFPQMIHAAVLDCFPPDFDEKRNDESNRVLWRIDYTGEQIWLYVLSREKPDFHHIVEQFGWPDSDQNGETKDYTKFLTRLETGQLWHFRLHANPVKTIEGKIIPHSTVEYQKEWLRTRSLKNGFSFGQIEIGGEKYDDYDVIYRNIIKFKKSPLDKTRVTLSVATFEGVLMIEDVDLLCNALCAGIGRAKAYGCGLMTLANAT